MPAYSVTAPGDAQTSLTVGAVAWADDTLEYYSSQGPTNDGRLKPEISGPTRVSGYTYGDEGFDGTSASTPHVAGAAALVWEAYPALTREELYDYLINATRDLGPGGPDTGYGFGRLSLPDAPLGVIGGPTPTPEIVSAPDPGGSSFATSTPAAPIVPTPVAFTTPEPQEEPRKSVGSLLVALVVLAGFGLGGGGLLLIGGILRVVDLRSRRRGDGRVARPPSQSVRPAVSSPVQQPVARQASPPPAAPAASLGATQIWMPGPDAATPVPKPAPTAIPTPVLPRFRPRRLKPTPISAAASSVDLRCPSCNAPSAAAPACPTCGQRLDDDQAVGQPPAVHVCRRIAGSARNAADLCRVGVPGGIALALNCDVAWEVNHEVIRSAFRLATRSVASGEHEPGPCQNRHAGAPPAAPGQRDTCAPTQPMAAANSSLGSGGGHGRPARPPAGPPVGVCTDVGRRRALNEDSYLALDLGRGNQGACVVRRRRRDGRI